MGSAAHGGGPGVALQEVAAPAAEEVAGAADDQLEAHLRLSGRSPAYGKGFDTGRGRVPDFCWFSSLLVVFLGGSGRFSYPPGLF